MRWEMHLLIGVATIFIAAFMLFFLLDNIAQIQERCKVETSETCEKMNPLSFNLAIILIILAGFFIIISITSYILLSPKGLVW